MKHKVKYSQLVSSVNDHMSTEIKINSKENYKSFGMLPKQWKLK